jgi:2-polyprenyl-3-methyl-5-hydroxy-6-metoxy-1,4-benzoquinol methylase
VVLDVGCAEGFLGQLLNLHDFWLIGADADEVALAQAPPVYRQRIQANIETDLYLRLDRSPDALVLADILEHTREPEMCLRSLLSRHLQSGTRVIISLPNVAHLYVRLSLLAGRFCYTDRGILDRTHLRFFTWQARRHFLMFRL